MNYKQALELCISAHKDQWRRPTILSDLEGMDLLGDELAKDIMHNARPYYDDCTIMVGDIKVTYDHLNEHWLVARPYSSHPIAVAAMMNTEYRKVLALLHDVVEDCPYELLRVTAEDYTLKYYIAHKEHPEQYEISYDLFKDLGLVARDPSMDYISNINRITLSGRKDAIVVKIADNIHNLSTSNSDKQKKKYLTISLPILLGNL